MFSTVKNMQNKWSCKQPVCDYKNGYFSVSVIKYSN